MKSYYIIFEWKSSTGTWKSWRIIETGYNLDNSQDLQEYIKKMEEEYDSFILNSWRELNG